MLPGNARDRVEEIRPVLILKVRREGFKWGLLQSPGGTRELGRDVDSQYRD